MDLSKEVEIVPTRMLERDMEKAQAQADREETIIHEAPPLPKRGRGRPSNQERIRTENATTIVEPAKPYKFEKAVREQLLDVVVWSSKTIDMGIDYGLGVDTADAPIWTLQPEDADVIVRILERRAARSAFVRDTVVPKMLEGRDYLEAGILLAPRFVTTVQAVVDNGGVKPRLFKKRER